MKALLSWHASPEELDRIREHVPAEVELVMTPDRPYVAPYECDPEDFVELARDVDVIMGWATPPRAAIEGAKNLKFISWFHAGCDPLDFPLLRAHGVQVSNVADAHAVTVAEQAWALILALAKRVIQNHRTVVEVNRQAWWEPGHVSVELAGKTMAVIGLGRIGEAIAKRAKAFDMHVIGLKRDPTRHAGHADEVVSIDALHSVLPRTDFVVLAVPLSPATRHLIGEAELRAMKPTAFLVNVGRSATVHEAPLARALKENWIAGFASDVWWIPRSPHFSTPSRYEIHRMPNVVGSNDVAANAMEVKDRMISVGAENAGAFARGEVPPRLVDLELGY